jgi:hypothetical protein
MQEFPELNGNQVALLRAECKTGHIVDENFNLAIEESQKVYTIFNDMDAALDATKMIFEQKKGIEIAIYGKDRNILKHLSPDQFI